VLVVVVLPLPGGEQLPAVEDRGPDHRRAQVDERLRAGAGAAEPDDGARTERVDPGPAGAVGQIDVHLVRLHVDPTGPHGGVVAGEVERAHGGDPRFLLQRLTLQVYHRPLTRTAQWRRPGSRGRMGACQPILRPRPAPSTSGSTRCAPSPG